MADQRAAAVSAKGRCDCKWGAVIRNNQLQFTVIAAEIIW